MKENTEASMTNSQDDSRQQPTKEEEGEKQPNWLLPQSSSLLVSLTILIVLVFASGFVSTREIIPPPTSLQEKFPTVIGDYRSTGDAAVEPEIIEVLELSDYLNRTYISPEGNSVHLYVGYVKSQSERPLIHTPIGCLPGGGNTIERTEIVDWWSVGGQDIPKNIKLVYLAQKGQQKQIVAYWYQERGRIISNDHMERFYLFWDAFRYGRTDGALVRFIMPGSQNESLDKSKEKLREFVQLAIPFLQNNLPGN